MPVPVALMAAGTALQVFGQFRANMAQAAAEKQNADFFNVQADYALDASFRQAEITSRQYEMRKGAQIGAYAKGGVDISGSAAGVIAETIAEKTGELNAIARKGQIEYTLAKLRARQAQGQADMLGSFEYNALQAGGTVLGNAAKSGVFNDKSSGQDISKFSDNTVAAGAALQTGQTGGGKQNPADFGFYQGGGPDGWIRPNGRGGYDHWPDNGMVA